jgi:hypothetical protein
MGYPIPQYILGYSQYSEQFLYFRKEKERKRKTETTSQRGLGEIPLSCPVVSTDFRHVADPYVCMQQHGMHDHFRLLSGSSPFHVTYQDLEVAGPHRVTKLKHVRRVGHGKAV